MQEVVAGQEWANGKNHPGKVVVLAVASNTERMDGAIAEQLVVYREAAGSPDIVWATPLWLFVDQFWYVGPAATA